jgi:hypothetical protein
MVNTLAKVKRICTLVYMEEKGHKRGELED